MPSLNFGNWSSSTTWGPQAGVRRCILPTGILDDLQLYHWILIDLKKIFDQIQVKTLTSEYQTVGWWLTKPSHVVDYG